MEDKTACCPACHEAGRGDVPLVATFAFAAKEFICLTCGETWDWFAPRPVAAELVADEAERVRAEWLEHAGPHLLSGGTMLRTCDECSRTGQPHLAHATEEEKQRHRDALEWIKERTAAARA